MTVDILSKLNTNGSGLNLRELTSTLVAAAVGAGLVDWRSPWVLGGAAVLMLLGAVAIRYQARIEHWIDQTVLPRVTKFGERATLPDRPADPPVEVIDCDAATH
jgi:hypothetical protein